MAQREPLQRPQTLPRLNDGRPMRVVYLDGVDAAGLPRMGIVDESTRRVWVEHTMRSSRVAGLATLREVPLPTIPPHYGSWRPTAAGGVGKTWRRMSLLRVAASERDVVLLVTHPTSATAVSHALQAEPCTVGRVEAQACGAHLTEVTVRHGDDVAMVAARVARVGGTPELERPTLDLGRELGVERLDRSGAEVLDDPLLAEGDDLHGPRRGLENWFFPWLPEGWDAPITWDHMVHNVRSEPLESLPRPLRDHAARSRLDTGRHPPIGSQWVVAERPPTEDEVWHSELYTDAEHDTHRYNRRILTLDAAVAAQIRAGDADVGIRVASPHVLARVDDVWYRPYDFAAAIRQHIPARRHVSAGLTAMQSKQLIVAHYLLVVERMDDTVVRKAMGLVLFQYMKESGYSSRWIGCYKKFAHHVGNGKGLRPFAALPQYQPHLLPRQVLIKLCSQDGKIVPRGSKGSRSKYKQRPGTKIPAG